MRTWNFGIIGAGLIADFHAKAIQTIPNAKLIGIFDLDGGKARDLAARYSCRAFGSSEELLESGEIDIVTIVTPSGAHMEPAIEAARNGKHVICEKPLEISLGRIDRMIEAHEKAGTVLGGIFNYRFNDPVRILKNAVEEGRFGVITCAGAYVPWWRSDDYYKNSWKGTEKLDGGGALMNQSIHMIDMLQYMVGPVRSLQAYTATHVHSIEVEDTAVAVLQFKSNALGVVYGTTASFPGQYRRIEITGNKGTASLVENSFKIWQFADENDEDLSIRMKYGEIEGGGGVSDPAAIAFEPHARNITAFIDALEKGETFEVNALEARKSVEIVLAIYESARTKRMIEFE